MFQTPSVPIPDLPAGLTPLEENARLSRDRASQQLPRIARSAAAQFFARRGRWLVVQVLEKESAVLTDLGTIRNRVLLDYRRNLAEQTLRDYLDDLRRPR